MLSVCHTDREPGGYAFRGSFGRVTSHGEERSSMSEQQLRVRLWTRGAAVGLAVLTVLAGCSAPASPVAPVAGNGEQRPPAAKKRVVAAVADEPPILNYTLNRAGAGGERGTTELDMLLNAGLVVADEQNQLQPQLAEMVPTIENGLWRLLPDGQMETTWRIRPNARWHDGTPITAEDLVFTLAVGTDAELDFVQYPAYGSIEGIEATDSRTVTVQWRSPFIAADTLFTTDAAWPFPKHVLEATYLEDKNKLVTHPYWSVDYVGTGPFRLREWVTGSHATLEANDQYVLGRPKIDEMVVRFIRDPNTLIANILAGEVDVNLGRGVSVEEATQAKVQWADGRL
ncbi:MAG: hypothetical protein GEU73_16115 [Chloroflexi bacterium]|nr:hypothetical protein [Chloroflexota bacterium]